MTELNKIKKDGFYISTPEFALMLGISTEALRSRRRRGELKDQYEFDGRNYWWKSLRPNQVNKVKNDRVVRGQSRLIPAASHQIRGSRSRRRGAHIEGQETRYPNQAFKNLNDARIFARITKGKDINYLKQLTDESLKAGREAMQREALNPVDNSKRNQDEAIQRRNDQWLIERDRIMTHNENLKWHDPLNPKQEEDEDQKKKNFYY